MKLGNAGKRIKTPRDFIKYLATWSSMSGKPYQLEMKDGKKASPGEWLTKRLEELEKMEAAAMKIKKTRDAKDAKKRKPTNTSTRVDPGRARPYHPSRGNAGG